jgi:hypothetical protein
MTLLTAHGSVELVVFPTVEETKLARSPTLMSANERGQVK